MKLTLVNLVVLVVVGYVVYTYFSRESMTNSQMITTAIGLVVGIAVLGGLYMYATSK